MSHTRTGPALKRQLRQAGVPVSRVIRKRSGVYIADIRTEKPPRWDGQIRREDHVPGAEAIIPLLRRAIPGLRVITTHESITSWRENPQDHVRFETSIIFTLADDSSDTPHSTRPAG
ncbi:MAG: hypothetical protein ACOCYT_00770 [Chloroflexota bacterium]